MPSTNTNLDERNERLEDALRRFREFRESNKVSDSGDVLIDDPVHELIQRRLKKQRTEREKKDTFDGRSVADLSFLYKRCPSMTANSLYQWMRFTPFTDKMRELKRSGVRISESDVVSVMKDLTVQYDAKYGKASRLNGWNFQQAIRKAERAGGQTGVKVLGSDLNPDVKVVVIPDVAKKLGVQVPMVASSTKVLKPDAKHIGIKELP